MNKGIGVCLDLLEGGKLCHHGGSWIMEMHKYDAEII